MAACRWFSIVVGSFIPGRVLLFDVGKCIEVETHVTVRGKESRTDSDKPVVEIIVILIVRKAQQYYRFDRKIHGF